MLSLGMWNEVGSMVSFHEITGRHHVSFPSFARTLKSVSCVGMGGGMAQGAAEGWRTASSACSPRVLRQRQHHVLHGQLVIAKFAALLLCALEERIHLRLVCLLQHQQAPRHDTSRCFGAGRTCQGTNGKAGMLVIGRVAR